MLAPVPLVPDVAVVVAVATVMLVVAVFVGDKLLPVEYPVEADIGAPPLSSPA